MRKHYYPNDTYVPTDNHLRILSTWRKHLSMRDTAATLGLAEQTVKNAMSTMRRRAGVPNSVLLVEKFWAYISDLEDGKLSRRRVRYQLDTDYRERQRAIAREGMRRIRAVYAGKRAEVYARLYEAQQGRCAICGRAEAEQHTRGGRIRKFSIDHDHATGQVRALLCLSCNTMLGNGGDSPERLEAGAKYLREHRQTTQHKVSGEAA